MEALFYSAVFVGIYFLPTIVAMTRHVPSWGSAFIINLFLGWTLLGWVVALAMACRTVPQAHLAELEARRKPRPVGSMFDGQERGRGYGWWKEKN